MNKVQREYRNAKKEYEKAFAQFRDDPLQAELDKVLDDDQEFERLDVILQKKYNLTQLRNDLIKAENALIKWGRQRLEKEPNWRPELEKVLECNLVHIRERALDLLSRMA